MKITVLGSGRWASFLAWYNDQNSHDVLLYGREGSKSLDELRSKRKNEYVELSERVRFTSDLRYAVDFGELILVAISAQKLRELCGRIGDGRGKTFVLCMKGIEEDTGLRLSQVVEETLGDSAKAAVWVGPGHPQDFVKGIPNCMVIDSNDPDLTRQVADALGSRLIRFYYGADLIGTEIGAGAKNVVGIAAGILDGLGYSSLKGVLMARGAREISRLVAALGGEEITVYGISHLGDYEATLFSPHSHNREYGESIIRGKSYDRLAEGVATAHSLVALAHKVGVELPICEAVVRVLSGEHQPKEILELLFSRSIKPEF